MKNLPEGAGSPISRMPHRTKDGLCPRRQPPRPNTAHILNLLIYVKNNKADMTINFKNLSIRQKFE